jgi:hypothetical protein
VLVASIVTAFALSIAPTSATLTSVAGVPVSCVDDATWAASFPSSVGTARGLYDTVNREIYLRAIECERLQILIAGGRSWNIRYQYDFASAVFLFGHEIAHSRGIGDETLADCAAGRSFLRTAATLGVGHTYGRVLADYLVNARIPQRCYPK